MSLDSQKDEIKRFADANNLEIVDFRDEVVSGGYPVERRPVMLQLLKDCQRDKGSVIVTARLDRFSRRVDFISNLLGDQRKYKVKFVSAECGMNASDMEIILRATFASEERRKISDRVKTGIQKRMSKGLPVGFCIDKNAGVMEKACKNSSVAVKNEADSFAEYMRPTIEHMRIIQKLTIRQIADKLNEEGRPTQRGGLWYAKSVSNIMNRWK
jgi:DNA invertase Pin-like site-specific DNA recombinase